MTTVTICLMGNKQLTTAFKQLMYAGKYLENVTSMTLNLKDEDITFTVDDVKPDGTVYIHEPNDKWGAVEQSLKTVKGKVVIVGWHKVDTKNTHEDANGLVELRPQPCAYPKPDSLKNIPYYPLMMCEQLWAPLQDIAETKLARELPYLVDLLAPAYWGEDLLV